MQLDAFLASVDLSARELFSKIVVVHTATSARFELGYQKLEPRDGLVRWVREKNFRDDVLRSIGDEELTVFHTDDDVYFRAPKPFDLHVDEVCFALRLGLNTTYCYPLDMEERLSGATVEGERVSWNWRTQEPGAYGYPLALNGHVFRTEAVRGWLTRASYANPNELEAALQAFLDEIEPRMASFTQSVVVSIPANRVNETFPNRHGNLAGVDELNERFLAGERIDVTEMDFSAVRSCHQEIPFAWRRARPVP